MKKPILFVFGLSMGLLAIGQDMVTPLVIDDLFGNFVSPDGKVVCGQDAFGSAISYNLETGEQSYYNGIYPGNGNFYASTGMMVGQSQTDAAGAIMYKNKWYTPDFLKVGSTSSINAITYDGTRACGYLSTTSGEILQIPFYVDIDAEGNLSEPVILPYPEKDFTGREPQFVTAVCISDDGNTISGFVTDLTGFYSYPIVYQQADDGTWEYTLPSEPLFNPDHLAIPEWPEYPEKPNVEDYMTDEELIVWKEALQDYYDNDGTDPYTVLYFFLTPEKLEEYMEAMTKYYEEDAIADAKVDEYWRQMAKIYNGSNFQLGVMALNPQGTQLSMAAGISLTNDELTETFSEFRIYNFNLVDDDYTYINSSIRNVVPRQLLSDGTLILVTPQLYLDYLILPDSETLVPFESWVESNYPSYLPWLKENLSTEMNVFNPETGSFEMQDVVRGGLLSFSEDMSVFAGGVPVSDYQYYTYVFGVEDATVEGIEADSENGKFTVYNLHGMKVMETTDKSQLNNLGKGIYIINGKKVLR